DVVIALDTSKSMLADDVVPSRIGSAKLAIQDLLRELDGERVALVAFAGTSFLQAPLTIDQGALQDTLDTMDTTIIPRGGTDIASAINTSIQAFGKAEGTNRAIVLFTDGEELEDDALKAAKAAKDAGIRIFTVGVGSSDGAMIPIQESGTSTFQRDNSGQFVKTRLNEKRLREIAEATDGFYVRLQNGSNAVETLINDGVNRLAEKEGEEKLSRRPIERYQWPLGLGLVLLMLAGTLSDRRRLPAGAAAAALLYLALVPQIHAEAGGLELYEQGKYKESLDAFQKKLAAHPRSPEWNFNTGAAAYKSENFNAALDAFGKAATSRDPALRKKAEYNAANTLFQRGARSEERSKKIDDWKSALSHYDEALKVDKDDANAKFNRDLVEKLLKEEDEKKKEQEKRDEKDKQDQQDQQQQQSSQQQQQQQSRNQQNKNQQQQQNGQQGQQGNQQRQSGPGQQQQQNQQQQNQQQRGQNQQQQPSSNQDRQPRGQGQQPPPQPEQGPGEKKQGELKTADRGQKNEQEKNADQSAQASAGEETREGNMSPEQARALLQAMQGEEVRVNLRDDTDDSQPAKDW
ncbi:MAG TPA: VWA domain-containing protein, partial [Chthoniobacterales bacterium]